MCVINCLLTYLTEHQTTNPWQCQNCCIMQSIHIGRLDEQTVISDIYSLVISELELKFHFIDILLPSNKSCINICLHRRHTITKGNCLPNILLWRMLSVHKYWYFACNFARRRCHKIASPPCKCRRLGKMKSPRGRDLRRKNRPSPKNSPHFIE